MNRFMSAGLALAIGGGQAVAVIDSERRVPAELASRADCPAQIANWIGPLDFPSDWDDPEHWDTVVPGSVPDSVEASISSGYVMKTSPEEVTNKIKALEVVSGGILQLEGDGFLDIGQCFGVMRVENSVLSLNGNSVLKAGNLSGISSSAVFVGPDAFLDISTSGVGISNSICVFEGIANVGSVSGIDSKVTIAGNGSYGIRMLEGSLRVLDVISAEIDFLTEAVNVQIRNSQLGVRGFSILGSIELDAGVLVGNNFLIDANAVADITVLSYSEIRGTEIEIFGSEYPRNLGFRVSGSFYSEGSPGRNSERDFGPIRFLGDSFLQFLNDESPDETIVVNTPLLGVESQFQIYTKGSGIVPDIEIRAGRIVVDGAEISGDLVPGAEFDSTNASWLGNAVRVIYDPQACLPADLVAPFGVIDIADVQGFVALVSAGEMAADLNGDSIIDLADVGVFIDNYLEGCGF